MAPPINYTARDFNTIMTSLTTHLQNKFPTTWKDFTASSMGQALLDVMAMGLDNLSFQIDVTANNLYLDTARDRRAVWLLGRMQGYSMRTPTSASVLCTATLPATYAEAIIIPAIKGDGTPNTVQTITGLNFYVPADTRIAAGLSTGTLLLVHGVLKSDSFAATGELWQKVVLTNSPVVQETLVVMVDGAEWTEVPSLVYANADSAMFAVTYDENNVATIEFGNNVSGKAPTAYSTIEVTYRTGGGVVGNIALNQIATSITGYKEGISPRAEVNVQLVNDVERGSGGEDAETVTHAKLWIPYWVRSKNRAVTESDYDALANAFYDPIYGSVAFAKARLKQEIPELNTVVLAVWGRDGSGVVCLPSSGLKTALETYFNQDGVNAVKMMCQHCEVEDGEIVYIDVRAEIKVSSDYATADVLTAVQEKIEALFASDAAIPGADYRLSLLYRDIQAVAGVEYSIISFIKASTLALETIGVGNDVLKTFTATLALPPGLSAIPGSIRAYYDSYGDTVPVQTLIDNGAGDIVDDASTVVGSIDYDTGAISVTFAAAPSDASFVYVEYRRLLDYQRGAQEATGDATTRRFKGTLANPPVNPFDTGTGQNGVAFSDGEQTVIDDGDGNLVDRDDYDSTIVGTIDYDTGAYDFTFPVAPGIDAAIMSTYRQILNVASQDVPIDKQQVAVKGLITVAAI
jgi:hypothetical protein